MLRSFTFLLQLVMAASCLLPLTNPRALASLSKTSDSGTMPNRPIQEEDESERSDAEQRDAELRVDRRFDHRSTNRQLENIPLAGSFRKVHRGSLESRQDPFRNGLGTHYRC